MGGGISPSHGGDFLEIIKFRFLCIIKFHLKLKMCTNCSTRGGRNCFYVKYNVYWASGGRVWEAWWDFGVLNPGFGCIIKLKLTMINSSSQYNIRSTRVGGGGGTISVDTKGEDPPPMVGTFPKFWYKTSLSCIKMLKFT